MKKKSLIVCIIMLLAISLKTQAATYSNYLPGGKNYINPENFRLSGDTIESIEYFKVLPNQSYTLTYPGDDMFFDSYLSIGGASGSTYIDGTAMDVSSCDVDQYLAICTFTTSSNETSLYLRIRSSGTLQFYQHYGLGDIQLEEGSNSSSYASYVAPEIDMEEPSFSQSGGFVLSYEDQTPIQTIIGDHITVQDEIDGDLSDQIVIESDNYTANSDRVGSYLVSLSATDSSGNTATFDLTILVKDELSPIISGPSSLDLSVDEGRSVDSILSEYYNIYDAYDGPLSYQITEDTYSANKNKVGVYDLSLSVVDASNNQTTKSIQIRLLDQTPPSILGVDAINSYLSDPKSIEDVLATQSVDDNYSSLSKQDLEVTDDFTANHLIVGDHSVVLDLVDGSGNQTSKTITITVIDDVKPFITGPITYIESYKENITIEGLKELISVSDNVDALSIDDLTILEDTLTSRTTEVGDFTVTFRVDDQSGNTTTHRIDITLVDDIPPVIYVDSYIINLSSGTSFTNEDALKLMLSANELSPGHYRMETLINEYQGNEENPGNYVYRVSFTSEEGDVTEKEFIIKVASEDGPLKAYFNLRRVLTFSLSFLLIGLTIYKVKK